MSLQGTLKTLGITEVLEFLAARNATGQLDVTTEMGTAVYLFSTGDVAQSEYSFIRERGNDAAEATYYVVSELDGTFFFDEDQEPVDVDSCEEVSSVLFRTAEIAEKWLEVEDTIPTPTHLLVRNTELDGSVTIQPEWWKALEVIGDGKTSLEVADKLDMGVLDASLLVLAMTNAGLLNVENIDALASQAPAVDEQDGVDDEVAVTEHEPVEIDEVVAEEAVAEPAPTEELAVEPLSMEPESAPAVEPVVAEVPVVAAVEAPAQPAPVVEETIDAAQAPAPSFATQPEEPAAAPEVATPVPVEEIAQQPVAAPADFQPAFEPAPAEVPAAVAEPVAAVQPAPTPAVDENDGWASDHSRSYDAGSPPVAAAPLAAVPDLAPIVEPTHELAPMPDTQPAPHAAADMFDANPVEAAVAPQMEIPQPAESVEPSTAMAGEVLSDLATLSDQLDNPGAEDQNWQLDGTFVAQDTPAEVQPDNDPFGDLGELLVDGDGDEDRGSVLKFLRRD